MRKCEQELCRWWTGDGCACGLMGLTSSGDFTQARHDLTRLHLIARAAEALMEHLSHSPSWKFSSGLTAESVELVSRLGIAVRTKERG